MFVERQPRGDCQLNARAEAREKTIDKNGGWMTGNKIGKMGNWTFDLIALI